MTDSPVAAAAEWSDFAVALAGASAALLGLAFVAISINLDAIVAAPTLPGRAAESLVWFAFALGGSLLLLVPGLEARALAAGQAVLVLLLAVTWWRVDLPRWRRERDDPLSWRLGHLLPGLVVTLLALVAVVATATSSWGGVSWWAAAMVSAVAFGLATSWVLLVEIKR